MRTILDSCANLQGAAKGSVAQQIGDLYASGMDSTAIDKAGISPLQPDLDRISQVKTTQDLLHEITTEFKGGDGALFGFYISPDDKNSNLERAHFDQGGLGLPNRDYYFKSDSTSQAIRKAYVSYLSTLLHLSGEDSVQAAGHAQQIMDLETKLAKASKSPVDLRDPNANYHLLSISQMEKTAPAITWPTLLSELNVHVDTLQVGQPEFTQAFQRC